MTETVSATVPVSREEVVVEREPITGGNQGQALDGARTCRSRSMVLPAQRPGGGQETVPWRGQARHPDFTEQLQINESVRREQIETDSADGTRPGSSSDLPGRRPDELS